MEEVISLEEKIVRYLKENMITIVPISEEDGTEILSFVQHLSGGQSRELGEIRYHGKTGMPYGADADNLRQSLQLQGFVTELRRPIVRLLMQTEGQFFEDGRWAPIHDACDYVEANYRGIIK